MIWTITTKTNTYTHHNDIIGGWDMLEHLLKHYPKIWADIVMIESKAS